MNLCIITYAALLWPSYKKFTKRAKQIDNRHRGHSIAFDVQRRVSQLAKQDDIPLNNEQTRQKGGKRRGFVFSLWQTHVSILPIFVVIYQRNVCRLFSKENIATFLVLVISQYKKKTFLGKSKCRSHTGNRTPATPDPNH